MRTLVQIALLASISTVAAAEDGLSLKCYPTQAVLAAFANQYNEVPAVEGTLMNGDRAVVFMAPQGESFTVFIMKGAMACQLLSGTDIKPVLSLDPGKPS